MKNEFPKHPLAKSYEPTPFETPIYEFWLKNNYFSAQDQAAPGQKSFCIVIPPPNVTGALHMGHALTNTLQDILIRWRRMKGDNTLWLPGTDHAGIATQAQVEKALAKEGKGPSGRPLSRHDIGRTAFVERTWKWKEQYGSTITGQLKRMGSSFDWNRERFTMDDGLSAAVREVFVRLYEEGLIYRGERIINWCPRCQTALSDLEVVPKERKGHFWHLVYKIVEKDGTPVRGEDGTPAQLVIATTRPETLLGDTAVAVHPEDDRYRSYHGKYAVLPLLGRLIPVITDEYVDREFGSGALKVTPAHDFNDYDLGKKHNLAMITVMGKDGRMTAEAGPFSGLKYAEAREKVLEALKTETLLAKTEDHVHKVGMCQRCDSVAEPIISKQWFVKIKPLADPAIEAVRSGKITFTPKNWEKTYFEWMNNIRDWCISRQLWWGHQIPAWYCADCGEITVSKQDPKNCTACKGKKLTQDEDVLDTWFSSGLWPFSTLGWPEKTDALKTFYPTSILETGFDIIFFWVARMIMMGIHFMGDVPFQKVYLHAMVRDEKGEKMSKSKGNVIDPLDLIEKHGADPLRFTLAIMAGQGRDIKLSTDRVEGYRAFCNKIWNAVKFFHLQFEEAQGGAVVAPEGGVEGWLSKNKKSLLIQNRWILSRFQSVVETVEKGLTAFELNSGAQALYEFSWHELCDWYIEFAKLPLREGGEARLQTLYTLQFILERLMKLMHPYMPFVTEELWQTLPWKALVSSGVIYDAQTIMKQPFPETHSAWVDTGAENAVDQLRELVQAFRNFRGENNISPKAEFAVFYRTENPTSENLIQTYLKVILSLARIQGLTKVTAPPQKSEQGPGESVILLEKLGVELRIPLEGLVDVEGESKRLEKEIEKYTEELSFIRSKLSKESFVAKAPPALVEKEKSRERELITKTQELAAALARLKPVKT